MAENKEYEPLWTSGESTGVRYDVGEYRTSCTKCSRPILVSLFYFGTVHNGRPIVTCGECVRIEDEYKELYPEVSKQIEDWVKETTEV